MKNYSVFYIGALLVFASPAQALQVNSPDYVGISAKYAKLKAKQRALGISATSDASQAVSSLNDDDPGSCDLNVGNVFVDDVGNAPDDVVIIIEGDILQSNNC